MKTTLCTPFGTTEAPSIHRSVRRLTVLLMMQLTALSPIRSLSAVFSAVMDEEVTPRQTVCIVNAMLALLFTVFSLAVPFLFRIICVVWLFLALRQCRREGLGEE